MILLRAIRSTLLSPLSFDHITRVHKDYIIFFWEEINKSIFEKLLYYIKMYLWNLYKPTIIQSNTHLDVNYGPGSSVGIATDYGLDGPGIESRWSEIFRPSIPALGAIQPPVKWVPGLSRG